VSRNHISIYLCNRYIDIVLVLNEMKNKNRNKKKNKKKIEKQKENKGHQPQFKNRILNHGSSN